MQHRAQPSQAGFTLVELSIVLVIIGLIVSGVLVGQDMIRAAEIRSTISQIESYNTAVNTFRDKYRGIPGDILSKDVDRFGFETRTGAVAHGDGNRLLEGCAAGATDLGCETSLFWRDLSQTGLVDNGFTTATDATETAATVDVVEDFLPPADIGLNHFITVYSAAGRNYFAIVQVNDVTAGAYGLSTGMPPQIAFNIDDKLDDGNPFNGSVEATWDTAALNTLITPAALTTNIPATAETDCAGNTAGGDPSYNTVTDDLANSPACQLRIRASF